MWQYNYNVEQELYHHGIKGQKWGVRRFQNPDGTLTDAGRKKLGQQQERLNKKYIRKAVMDKRYAKVAKDSLNDLKKNGKESKTFKNIYQLQNENEKTNLALNRINNSSKMSNFEKLAGSAAVLKKNNVHWKPGDGATKFAFDVGLNTYAEGLAKDQLLENSIKNFENSYKSSIAAAKKWESRSTAVMNINVDELAKTSSYKEIKKAISNTRKS